MSEKLSWRGRVTSVQARIRLTRSFDERSHTYLGFALRVQGTLRGQDAEFLVGIGKAAQAKHQLRVGDIVQGESEPVADPRLETVEFYKTSGLGVIERAAAQPNAGPPWRSVPPDLEVYRQRGHRRLDARSYEAKCRSCLWGCRMVVEMIIDQWKPDRRRFRVESFCYGPKSCRFYRAGQTRKVQGRKPYMVWEEADWVDEEATAHRGNDE